MKSIDTLNYIINHFHLWNISNISDFWNLNIIIDSNIIFLTPYNVIVPKFYSYESLNIFSTIIYFFLSVDLNLFIIFLDHILYITHTIVIYTHLDYLNNFENIIISLNQIYYDFLDYTTTYNNLLYYLCIFLIIFLNLLIIYLFKIFVDIFLNTIYNTIASSLNYFYIKNSRFTIYKVDISTLYMYIFYMKTSPMSFFNRIRFLLQNYINIKRIYTLIHIFSFYINQIAKYIQNFFLLRSIHSWGILITSIPLYFIKYWDYILYQKRLITIFNQRNSNFRELDTYILLMNDQKHLLLNYFFFFLPYLYKKNIKIIFFILNYFYNYYINLIYIYILKYNFLTNLINIYIYYFINIYIYSQKIFNFFYFNLFIVIYIKYKIFFIFYINMFLHYIIYNFITKIFFMDAYYTMQKFMINSLYINRIYLVKLVI